MQFCDACVERLTHDEVAVLFWELPPATRRFKNFVSWVGAMGALAAQLRLESDFDQDSPITGSEATALARLYLCTRRGIQEARDEKR